MDVSDGPNEWDAIMSVQEKEDEIRRLTVSFSCFSRLSAMSIITGATCHELTGIRLRPALRQKKREVSAVGQDLTSVHLCRFQKIFQKSRGAWCSSQEAMPSSRCMQ